MMQLDKTITLGSAPPVPSAGWYELENNFVSIFFLLISLSYVPEASKEAAPIGYMGSGGVWIKVPGLKNTPFCHPLSKVKHVGRCVVDMHPNVLVGVLETLGTP